MNFPLFQVPYLGDGMVIGLDAVLHVLLSHGVAIGMVAMIGVAAFLAHRHNDPRWERLARRLLTPAVIVITGVGAVTGVGIWFTTSVLAPRGIGSLLRVFFWPWFIEWIVFTLEVVAILVIYFRWDAWAETPRRRWGYALGYAILGAISAFLITGILGFMLTPDGWPWDKTLASAFFNPSFPPQLLLRLTAALALGSLFTLGFLLVMRLETDFRREALRIYGRILLGTVLLLPPLAWWYFSVVPSRFKTHAIFSVLTSRFSQTPEIFWVANAVAAGVILSLAVTALARSIGWARLLMIPALVCMIAGVTEFERIREFIRGPYLMPGYQYANQILISEHKFYDQTGLLNHDYWYAVRQPRRTPDTDGARLFARNCKVCHTIGGINDIRQRVQGRPADGIAAILSHLNEMVPFMPPFSGTQKERAVLAKFLHDLAAGRVSVSGLSRYDGITQGEKR